MMIPLFTLAIFMPVALPRGNFEFAALCRQFEPSGLAASCKSRWLSSCTHLKIDSLSQKQIGDAVSPTAQQRHHDDSAHAPIRSPCAAYSPNI